MATPQEKQTKKSPQSNTELVDSLRKVVRKIEPHLGFVYTVILLVGITLTVYLVTQSLRITTPSTVTTTTNENSFSISFDDATIKKIQTLNDYENQSFDVSIPDGRVNPFAE